jgi:hypothetical protein
MKSIFSRFAVIVASILVGDALLHGAEITVTGPDSSLLRYGLGKLQSTLQQKSDTLKRMSKPALGQSSMLLVSFDSASASGGIGHDGFRLIRLRDRLKVTGGSERGAMYGVLEVAEQIRLGTAWNQIQDRTVKAPFEFRAIKFNLPWAAYRTSFAIAIPHLLWSNRGADEMTVWLRHAFAPARNK